MILEIMYVWVSCADRDALKFVYTPKPDNSPHFNEFNKVILYHFSMLVVGNWACTAKSHQWGEPYPEFNV